MSVEPSLRLIKDAERAVAEDLLGHEAAVLTLLRTLRSLPPPGCVAVYGSWGMGKTTLLRRVQQQWEADVLGPTVWFDPWEHERRDDVLSPLLHAITVAVSGSRSLDQERVRHLLAGVIKTVLSLSIRAGTAFLFGGGAGDALKSLQGIGGLKPEDFEKHFEDWKQYNDEIKRAKTSFKEVVDIALSDSPATARLVVFLDDLDRCLPDNVVAVVEAVKLLLCGDTDCRALFVFALDRHVVSEAIKHRFPGSTLYTGDNYLEKIFDLSLEMPPVAFRHVRDFVAARCADNVELVRRIEDCFATREVGGVELACQVFSEPVFSNPRVLTRVLNRLTLLLADETRLRVIQGAASVGLFRRALAWIAGAERFQSFRSFFMTATMPELAQLDEIANGIRRNSQEVLPAVAALAALPGFPRYYRLLDLDGGEGLNRLEHERKPTGGLATLRDWDDLLRRAGL